MRIFEFDFFVSNVSSTVVRSEFACVSDIYGWLRTHHTSACVLCLAHLYYIGSSGQQVCSLLVLVRQRVRQRHLCIEWTDTPTYMCDMEGEIGVLLLYVFFPLE